MSDEQGAIPEARAHKMAPGGYGHGLSHCEYCKATDREIAFALGPVCPNAPTPDADRLTDTGEGAAYWQGYDAGKRAALAAPKPPVDAGAMRSALEAWRLKDGYVPAYIAGWNAMLDQALAIISRNLPDAGEPL